MKFLKKIGSSIYNPAFYSDLLTTPFKKSLKYFLGLVLVIVLISTALLSVQLVPEANAFVSTLGVKVLSQYPDGLEVTIKKGVASTNMPEPYIVKIPEEAKSSQSPTSQQFENAVVFDTTHEFSVARFEEQKTFALVTKDMFVYKDKDGKITLQSLSKIPDVVITKALITKWVTKLTPLLSKLTFVLPVLIFIGLYLAYVSKLIYFLIAALLVWIVAKIKGVQIGYKKAYQITLHAFTLPLVLTFLLYTVGMGSIIFVPTILLLVVVLINLKKSGTPSLS